ncbi:MAG TPA: NAD-glutamate dehydrogenase [Pseudolabrys sp.]|uniref:NAD-glutamate dehydrogenase n=1 Tax=Pseudolabrys sp. TaxID=1960880 RepID=UPI002DDC9C9B|nr:NAD-glutamate dehydrogenase [Pseudolabrys sp.]HEV2629935.1 NAD-glutamate dehydrogenase [Pseudolabrys sp.]
MAGDVTASDEAAARDLLEQAQAQLSSLDPHVATGFAAQLYGRAVPEDLLHYGPADLAMLAAHAYALLAERTPGTAKIRCEKVMLADSGERKAIGVVEIVNDDMPFLLDSVMGELSERRLPVRLVAHPVLDVQRESGRLVTIGGPGAGARESFIHLHVDGLDDEAACADLTKALEAILAEVRLAVVDWRPMLDRVNGIVADLKTNPPPLPVDELAEAIQFLQWLLADNFTFLGVRNYRFENDDLVPDFDNALGIMRQRELRVLRRGSELLEMTPEIMAFLKEPRPLIVAKANIHARVHRRVYLDYIGVKHFDAAGNLVGEQRIVGLFTSTAYTRAAHGIPYLRRKLASVESRAGFDPGSHSGKALANVLEHYPRDELFQVDENTLYQNAIAILQLDERPRVRVLPRRDRFDRFVSVLVYVPRERYDSDIRAKIGTYLASIFVGRVSAYYPFFPEGPLVRVHYIIGRSGGAPVDIPRVKLESEVGDIVRTWSDGLADALALVHPPEKTRELYGRYRDAFSAGFRDGYAPTVAAGDIRVIDGLSEERPLGVDFHHRLEEEQRAVGLKVWSYAEPVPLSDRVPVLENMGFRVVDERTYHIQPGGHAGAWFHDMLLERRDGAAIELDDGKARLEAAFLMVMRGQAESDGYNALTLIGGLGWRDVALIRTVSRFLRQARVPYSQDYMWATLVKHSAIAAEIVALFHARFDPRGNDGRDAKQKEIAARIDAELAKVDSLDEDRILRLFVNAVQSGIRTNFYQVDGNGQPKAQIAIKFESRKLTELPLPRPLYEIFVYSPRVEGVHLRFGKVARGGIRWSDRPQDFRTEILGLVKAQQVKNAVIVPVGAKGGFVPKLMPKAPTREQFQAEGVATYRLFISTLLDITDNIDADGKLVKPVNVVRHEGDDPYLVVAADKGTATFSDIANGLAIEHGYWLGDAFASGGSAGYDHKAMGITARGAWESVKRHFREMDVNIHETPFTAVGVGDMSGDVFGNGMLREETTRLLAAFDHRDIFVDPDPDPKAAFAERQRLFNLPRSSWQDYDKSLISKGGGVYPRSSKEIHLSPEAQQLFGVAASVTPQALMKAILKAKVDLLFFGGIGTYIRAATETDEAVGDRANDSIRITGADLNCKVVGEGANLGMTQRGRIETALRGIRLNTDAIDNSAGVNTSDVEVNIKIALSTPVRAGALTTENRNALLAEMTDEVARLVLRNNYQQTLALSLAQRRGMEDFGFQQRLMHILEQRGELDRAVEYLPDEMALGERRKRNAPLTRPELAVLLAYAKLSLYSELLESDVPDDPYLGRELNRYFPKEMTERYPDALQSHRLRREIIATQLTNSMINRGGATLIVRIADQTGASSASIAAAFAAVRQSYEMVALNSEIDALDNKVKGDVQLSLYAAVQNLLLDRIVWFLRNVDLHKGLDAIVAHYREGIAQVEAALATALSKPAQAARDARADEFIRNGVPEDVAHRIADFVELKAAPDIVLVADRAQKPVAEVTATYFATEAFFQLDRVAGAVPNIVVADYFDRLALDRALDSIGDAERRLTAAMVGNGHAGAGAVEEWVKPRQTEVERIRAAIHEIAGSGLTLSKLSVAASLLGDLARE